MHQVCCRREIQKSSEGVIEEINAGIRKTDEEERLQVFFWPYKKPIIFEIYIHGKVEISMDMASNSTVAITHSNLADNSRDKV
jgi:hypothetical protein